MINEIKKKMALIIPLILFISNILFSFSTIQPNSSNLNPFIVSDYDTIDLNFHQISLLQKQHLIGKYERSGRSYSAFFSTFAPSKLSFYPSTRLGCKALFFTSSTSNETYNCEYATNGAFFTWDMPDSGSLCIGNLISDGKVWQLPSDGTGTNRANFGITSNGKAIFGFPSYELLQSTSFDQLITGWGWLVRKGVNFVKYSPDLTYEPNGFTFEKAPRTSVGLLKNGSMFLLEVDGQENIRYGPDLFELADLLVSLGAYEAINIDGGGSSVSVYNGNIIDRPTCYDNSTVCERAVASIVCVNR